MEDTAHGGSAAVFDWYAATLGAPVGAIEHQLNRYLGTDSKLARGLHGYPAGLDFTREGETVAKMIFGGDRSPHVWATGSDARDLARILRWIWPKHNVTRCDVAYDFMEGTPWAALYGACLTVADLLENGTPRQRKLKLNMAGDWARAEEGYPGGRTLYVGSFKSPVMVRLYEKGKQMRALYPDQLEKYPEGWVRLEVQVRPEGPARRDVAQLEPDAIWGVARWTRQLWQLLHGGDLAPVLMAQHRPPDDARAWHFMVRQYGPLLRRKIDSLGHLDGPARLEAWAELGRDLGRALG